MITEKYSDLFAAPEVGCNCRHLPDSATCWECSDRCEPILVADGGQEIAEDPAEKPVDKRADTPKPSTPVEGVLEHGLVERVDDLEDRMAKRDEVATDLWAALHQVRQRVDQMDDRLTDLEAALAHAEGNDG